jgi:hypothetical protein
VVSLSLANIPIIIISRRLLQPRDLVQPPETQQQ